MADKGGGAHIGGQPRESDKTGLVVESGGKGVLAGLLKGISIRTPLGGIEREDREAG